MAEIFALGSRNWTMLGEVLLQVMVNRQGMGVIFRPKSGNNMNGLKIYHINGLKIYEADSGHGVYHNSHQ